MSDMPTSVSEVPTRGPGSRRDTVGRGVFLVFILNLIQAGAGAMTLGGVGALDGIGGILLFGFGAVELVYVIPLAIVAYRCGERERMKGIIIGGSIGVLLTGACWGVLLTVVKF